MRGEPVVFFADGPKGKSMTWKLVSVFGVALALAACGTEPGERTTGGAAAGAATGAGVGALGGPVGALAGAAIGAGAGAVTGAVTEPSDVNLGKPPWTNPQARVPMVDGRGDAGRRAAQARPAGMQWVRDAQRELSQRGFDAGPADGVWGPRTAEATRAFQQANNMETTGRLDQQTLAALDINAPGGRPTNGTQRN